MSFSSELKETIINSVYKSACCRRSLLLGALLAKGEAVGADIEIKLEKTEYCNFLSHPIEEIYAKVPTVTAPPKGGRCRVMKFSSKSMASLYERINNAGTELFSPKCQSCTSAFLRGVFLACGRMTDPNKAFCLEFSLGNRYETFQACFQELGLPFKYVKRKTENILYTKNSSVIEDFFAISELVDATFTVINIKFENEQKNIANRLTNLDSGNISRAVGAAQEQYALIFELSERNMLSKLPDELRATAELRLDHPEMSMAQLAMHSIPPITKSGLSHRMNKIMKLAKELLLK